MSDRHACPDCGASHRKRATQKPSTTAPRRDATTDLDVTTCRHCKATVIAGRILAIDRQLAPQPLNELGWRTYRGAGRRLFTRVGVRASPHDPVLTRWPPERRQVFLLEHHCGETIPDLFIENNVTDNKRTIDFPDNPPY